MTACFERPQAEWPAAFDAACREHPEHADEIKRRLRTVQLMEATRPPGAELDEAFPEQLGDFDLIERLGGGGMGVVYRARQRSLGREVALKLIRPEHLYFSGARDRFRREVEAVAQLQHPGIVAIHVVDEERGIPFFAMELLEGRTLAELLRDLEGRAPESLTGADLYRGLTGMDPEAGAPAIFHGTWVDACLDLVTQVAGALQHAHERDILHRDVKPSNVVLLPDGRAILLDFGLTSSAEPSDRVTQTGSPVGTLVYMSPEQVEARTLDGRTDVYSLGVTLYELLTLQVPFRGDGVAQTQKLIVEGGPDSIRARNRRVDPDAEIACQTAMSARIGDRYASAGDFARDLEHVRARRPIEARPPGPTKRLLRWMERNKARTAAAALGFLLVVGLPTGLLIQESRYAKEIDREHTNVLRLSAFHKLAEHIARADALWPPTPDLVQDYEEWLAGARDLRGELDFALAQRDEVRARALPMDPELEAGSHPKRAELDALIAKRDALRFQEEVRTGQREVEELELEDPPEDVTIQYLRAWTYVAPEWRQYGRELEALALSRLAYEGAENDEDFNQATWALAWSLHSVGLDEDARDAAAEAMDQGIAGDAEKLARLEEELRRVEDGGLLEEIAALEAPIAALEVEVAERHSWRFELDEDRWWHDQLEKLIAAFGPFFDDGTGLVRGISPVHHWGVEQRLIFAREIEERTLTGPAARAAWEEAIASIRDVAECPLYDGLEIVPQLGLLPVGRNEETGLWEFHHVMSGAHPRRDRDTGELNDPDMGIVLVLLPGGEFWMGAQSRHPNGHNHDPSATQAEEPPHRVTLEPFFLSKYELAQRQWKNFTGVNPSEYSDTKTHWIANHSSALHPVELVSWRECATFLKRMGLDFPTEAQWEYAARAGTDTIWWTGDDDHSLEGAVNVADATALALGGRIWPEYVDWEDGSPVHAAAETHRPNPFGLYQMVGNVSEWCRDPYEGYAYPIVSSDGLRGIPENGSRIVRGGAYPNGLWTSRAAARQGWDETATHNWVGVRPARRLERP